MWGEVLLTKLIDKFQTLLQGKNGNWIAAQDKKEDPMIKAMQAQIKLSQRQDEDFRRVIESY